MALDTSIYGSYITTGLDAASNLVNSNTQKAYTPYTSSAANAPTQTQMYDYTQSSPLQQINAPNYTLSAGNAPQYQGLMGGDYNQLQTALTQPGQQAATNAYNTGIQNLTNTMGGRGLYGSSIMGQQQIQGLDREYMNALATNSSNAAAQRYGMEQADLKSLNDFGLNIYAQKLAEQQNQNSFNLQNAAGLRDQALNTANVDFTQADSMNQYNNLKYNARKEYDTNLNNWQNQQNYERNFVYPQAAAAYGDAQREQMMNQALALAGQGAPLATAASNQELQSAQLAAQQAAARQNYNAQLWGSAAGALGSLGSGLLSSAANQPTSTTWNNLWS